MKKKFLSLALAALMLFGVTGCNLSTPASVGTIGGVDIPAGIYLLVQYNAYNTVSGLADLATGESAKDVKKVLKAECTGTIGDTVVTTDGAHYVSQLTLRGIQYYAAVEKTFADLGATLEDAATAEAASSADSMWQSNGDLYAANGIGKDTLNAYLLNTKKADACLEATYGPDGTDPVSDGEYAAYIDDSCYYLETVQLPLYDSTTYAFADTAETAQIESLAEECAGTLRGYATAETAGTDGSYALYMAAMEYVPQAFAALGSSVDSTNAMYYAGSGLYTPDSLASYDTGDGNTLTDAVDAAGMGEWTVVNLGLSIAVVRKVDPYIYGTAAELAANYNLLNAMKSQEMEDTFYAEGAAMEQALDKSAMNTYKARRIKTSA